MDIHTLTVTAIVATSKWYKETRNAYRAERYPEMVYIEAARDYNLPDGA